MERVDGTVRSREVENYGERGAISRGGGGE